MRHCARKSWRWSFCTARSNIVLFFQSFFKDSPFKRFAFLKADVSTFCELYVLRFFPIIWQYAQHIFIVIGDNALLADRERGCIDKKYTYKIYTKDHLTIIDISKSYHAMCNVISKSFCHITVIQKSFRVILGSFQSCMKIISRLIQNHLKSFDVRNCSTDHSKTFEDRCSTSFRATLNRTSSCTTCTREILSMFRSFFPWRDKEIGGSRSNV